MKAVTTATVGSLPKGRRAEEDQRRERRRQLRNLYQEQLKRAYTARAYAAFASDAQQNVHRRSFAEDALMNTMRTTASWWGDICDRAIQRQLTVDKALRSRAEYEETYYDLTKKREAMEQMNVEESDQMRWEAINAEHTKRYQRNRDDAVESVVQYLLSETVETAAVLENFGLSDPKNSLLATFAMKQRREEIVANAGPSDAPVHSPTGYLSVATREIFEFFFHAQNPFQLSSPEFLCFLRMLYDQADTPVNIANVLKISPIPIFVLDGPKYSGKTLLGEYLQQKYRLLCISDVSLVERAMKAAAVCRQGVAPEVKEERRMSAEETIENEEAVEPEKVEVLKPRIVGILEPEVVEAVEPEKGELVGPEKVEAAEPAKIKEEASEVPSPPFAPSPPPPPPPPPPQDRWATYGEEIYQSLRHGGAIALETIVELFYIQLEELRRSNDEQYEAILLEGVLKTVEAYKEINLQFHRIVEHPWKLLFREWHTLTPNDDAENGDTTADFMMTLTDLDVCSPEVLIDAKTRRIPPPFRVPLYPADEGNTKVESRSRPAKKADIASLPPPDLPEVADVREQIRKEHIFITNAVKELSSLPSVLSGVLYIQCDPKEIFRRFAGMRIDTGTGAIYHMLYNPPPKERLPFLVNMDRADVSSVELVDVVFLHVAQWAAVQKWLQQQRSPSFSRVYELCGNGPVEDIQNEAVDLVGQVLSNFSISLELHQHLSTSEGNLNRLLAQWRQQVAAREAERNRLASMYLEKGAPLPPPLERPSDHASLAIHSTPPGIPDVVFRVLNDLTLDYIETYSTTWKNLGKLVHLFLQYYRSADDRLQEFWKRPDDKELILHRFQRQFNQLPKALLSHVGCKEELHVCLMELRDTLYHSIATKKEESYQYIHVMVGREACLDSWEGLVRQEGMTLLQCETDRFLTVVNMYLLYFGTTSDAPFLFEDIDIEMPVMMKSSPDRIGTATSLNDTSVSSAAKNTKERKSTTAKRTHGKSPDEQMEKSAEDVFINAVQTVSASLSGIVERLRLVLEANGKTQKRNATTLSASAALAATKCLVVIEAELAATLERFQSISQFFCQLLKEAEQHAHQMQLRMETSIGAVIEKQATAVNTALYVLRSSVECERGSPALHLGCTTFAVLDNTEVLDETNAETQKQQQENGVRRSFLTDVPLYGTLYDVSVLIHSTLPASRLLELTILFRSTAPTNSLSRSDFNLLLRDEDFAGALDDDAGSGVVLKSKDEVFDAFDVRQSGFLDWRDLVVHLLFWCTPPPAVAASSKSSSLYIPEPSMESLLTTHESLGYAPVGEEDFFEAPLFFDATLSDERLEAYTRVLWITFHDPATETLDPYILLSFLCSDIQPIRGAQKAFSVLSKLASPGYLTFAEMDALFHLKANNPRLMAQPDPCSKVHLHLLFKDAKQLSFDDVCLSPMGRKILNNADLFRRRTFVKKMYVL